MSRPMFLVKAHGIALVSLQLDGRANATRRQVRDKLTSKPGLRAWTRARTSSRDLEAEFEPGLQLGLF